MAIENDILEKVHIEEVVWSDLKNNTKKKAAKINKGARGTGGGPALQIRLSELEERVLSILGPQAASGLMGVPETGFFRLHFFLLDRQTSLMYQHRRRRHRQFTRRILHQLIVSQLNEGRHLVVGTRNFLRKKHEDEIELEREKLRIKEKEIYQHP
ncbi:uncharacterized protein LOC132903553 [Amyelois transitella]|uniref:uncharacterized protein LOC132903553 n=1 Tax=Amyelois transitella TaxID=680683 RepID=UPI0029900BD3|nr:uncharacterized protein LOC132903553 [Amyelois transitella]